MLATPAPHQDAATAKGVELQGEPQAEAESKPAETKTEVGTKTVSAEAAAAPAAGTEDRCWEGSGGRSDEGGRGGAMSVVLRCASAEALQGLLGPVPVHFNTRMVMLRVGSH